MPKSSKNIAMLQYTFMFDSAKTWSRLSDFENTFAKYLEMIGMEAEVIPSISLNNGSRVLYIYKKEERPLPAMPNKNPSDKFKQMRIHAGSKSTARR